MKILQVNCVYKKGSTGKIVEDIHNVLIDNGIESVVCYGRGKKINDENVYKTSTEFEAKLNNLKSRMGGLQYGGCIFATNKLLKIIKKEKPDIVHLHCINGFFVSIYRLVEFLKKNNIPTVLTLHAEFMHTGNCGHAYECNKWLTGCGNCPDVKGATYSYTLDRTAEAWQKLKHTFENFKNIKIVSVSPWLQNRAEQSPILKGFEHTTILNGINCDIFKPCESNLREKLGLQNKYIILHVTASFSSAVKGGQYVRELAKRLGNKATIIVIGSYERSENLTPNILDIGRVENQAELAKYYSMADLSIVTGKRETFSMPIAESLCCGTPAVGFKAGGPETIAISDYCAFCEYGDTDALEQLVLTQMKTKQKTESISADAIKKYSKTKMTNDYMRIYRNLIN